MTAGFVTLFAAFSDRIRYPVFSTLLAAFVAAPCVLASESSPSSGDEGFDPKERLFLVEGKYVPGALYQYEQSLRTIAKSLVAICKRAKKGVPNDGLVKLTGSALNDRLATIYALDAIFAAVNEAGLATQEEALEAYARELYPMADENSSAKVEFEEALREYKDAFIDMNAEHEIAQVQSFLKSYKDILIIGTEVEWQQLNVEASHAAQNTIVGRESTYDAVNAAVRKALSPFRDPHHVSASADVVADRALKVGTVAAFDDILASSAGSVFLSAYLSARHVLDSDRKERALSTLEPWRMLTREQGHHPLFKAALKVFDAK